MLTPLADPGFDIGTLVVPIASDEEANTASFVKAACAFDDGRAVAPALYFSRVPIPWGDGPRWHHVGIYAYRRAALARFVVAAARRRWNGARAWNNCARWRPACASPARGWSIAPFGVDTPEDLERARRLLAPGGPNAAGRA